MVESMFHSNVLKNKVYLLPHDMFVENHGVKAEAPKLLRSSSVPFYRADNLISLLSLVTKYGEVHRTHDSLNTIQIEDFSNIVFRLKIQELDLAVKLGMNPTKDQAFTNTLSEGLGFDKYLSRNFGRYFFLPSFHQSLVYNQVGGFILGHAIAPTYVPQLHSVLTHSYDGVDYAIGYVTQFIEGKCSDIEGAINSMETDKEREELSDIVSRQFYKANVKIDKIGLNAITKPDGTVSIIDLGLSRNSDTINHTLEELLIP